MNSGKYIAFEGGEGVGKSTQAALLAPAIGALLVREPGGTPLGEKLRGLLLDPTSERTNRMTDVLLMAASRAELVTSVVGPSLAQGHHIVTDRSWISSVAYQGAQEISIDDIKAINRHTLGRYMYHDLVILLDADPSDAHQRISHEHDYYEEQGNEFHRVVRELFLHTATEVDAVVLDAMQPIHDVTKQVRTAVQERLGI